ncbi:ATP-binding protein [Streptomyces sp. HK10]|uniref:ATP-binding protein n=1 Tax=Streptomyces sp. HK10 TaxID=3373255 RepID=UPI0037479327
MTNPTAYGTGPMVTEQPKPQHDGLDLEMQIRAGTLLAHMAVGPEVLSGLRAATVQVLQDAGIDAETAHTAQLVLSELVGNAVRACGDGAPLIVEVRADTGRVSVSVTDPDPDHLPRPGAARLDSADAESGRGLSIVGLLCEYIDTDIIAVGKRVRCLIAS